HREGGRGRGRRPDSGGRVRGAPRRDRSRRGPRLVASVEGSPARIRRAPSRGLPRSAPAGPSDAVSVRRHPPCRGPSSGSEVTVAVDAKTLEPPELTLKKDRSLDRKWDLVVWGTAAFVVGAAADITKQLFAGDWDFWTDWKDRQWWPIITPSAIILIGSALQYIQWLAWRFPTGMTYTAVGLWLCTFIGRWLQWGAFVYYPMNHRWPG